MTFKDGTYYPLGYSDGMSEGAYEAMFDEQYADLCLPPACLSEEPGYWRTRDKRVLKIAEMSTVHLKNAIRIFVAWNTHDKIVELREELAGRTP